MELGPASGLCCGYTMTRAILGDAIALVRGKCNTVDFGAVETCLVSGAGAELWFADDAVAGDRFYTTDYTRQ